MRINLRRIVLAMAALAVIAAASVSCEKPGPDKPDVPTGELALELSQLVSDFNAGSQFLKVSAPGAWTISVVLTAQDGEWARVSTPAGTGNLKSNIFSWEKNDSKESRTATIVISCGKESSSVTFTQTGKSATPVVPTGLNPDPVPDWLELPATDDQGRYFFTHDMTVGSYKGRNYSFYLDAAAKISVWVAYPLNKSLIGSGSRTDAWQVDPKVPRAYQPVVSSAFKGGYQRGHQCPSADRYARGANEATFYGTNMTPQKGVLNEYAWATLEGYVRSWSNSFDTLYVVTGADIQRIYDYARDADGKEIAVPCGYFKALLGYKKKGTIGITPSTGGYTAIGFYFNHESYDDSEIMGQAMSIDDLEKKTGFDFFPNLSSRIGETLAATVESTKDSWWK